MKAIQIVIEEGLLEAVDREARRAKTNRSAFVRQALREHLERRRARELEDKDSAGYSKYPPVEFEGWEQVQSWPND